jgi:tetratricopeptide (TPR) repeat protein
MWAKRAIVALDGSTRDTRLEMELQAAFGLTGMFTEGNSEMVRAAFVKSLDLSQSLDEPVHQLRMLGRLHIFHERIGDYHSALAFAQRGESVANGIGDPAAISAAHSLLGIAHHLRGDQSLTRQHLDIALSLPPVSERIDENYFGFHHQNRAGIALARTLWLQGFAGQAQDVALSTIEEAEALDHPVSLCMALIWAVSVFLWSGDLDSADCYIEHFIAHADKHSLAPYNAVGQGVKGQLLTKRGQIDAGIALIGGALGTLREARYELLTTEFNSTLAEALAAKKQFEQALAITGETIAQAERGGDMFYMPELLRIKADILAAALPAGLAEPGMYFERSIELARRQSSMSWELRAATSLALWQAGNGQHVRAYALLADVYARFTEGFQSADLKKARDVLDSLSVPAAR